MAKTIYVRGEGGAIIAMDLPLPEGIAERFERGLLARVHSDGSPYAAAPAPAAAVTEAPPTPDDAGAGGSDLTAGRPPRPAVNATKSEWIAFVVGQGQISAEDAAAYTKADLIDLAK